MDFLKKLWIRMNEPEVERVLIVLVPCLTVLIVALILTPTLLSFRSDDPVDAISVSEPPVVPSYDPFPDTPILTGEKAPYIPEPVEGWGWQYDGDAVRYLKPNGDYANSLEQIDGKLYYFDQYGRKAAKLGIDVSTYNEMVSWETVKASGIDFAILRVGARGFGSGLLYNDDCFTRNLYAAKHAGLDVGVYYYTAAVSPVEAVEEAEYVLHCLDGARLDCPVYLDIEASMDYPYGRSDVLDKSMRMAIIQSFCRVIERAGYRAGVYSSAYFLQINLPTDFITRRDVWIAHYTENNRLPSFDRRYDMWQFTQYGRVWGVNGCVDMNAVM